MYHLLGVLVERRGLAVGLSGSRRSVEVGGLVLSGGHLDLKGRMGVRGKGAKKREGRRKAGRGICQADGVAA